MTLPLALGFWFFAGFGVLGLATAILWVLALVDLFGKRTDLDRRQRSAWILVVVLLPIVGSIWYLLQRPVLEDEREDILNAQSRKFDRLSR
jgi:hypothetical protein